jgi:hypothetical protein
MCAILRCVLEYHVSKVTTRLHTVAKSISPALHQRFIMQQAQAGEASVLVLVFMVMLALMC